MTEEEKEALFAAARNLGGADLDFSVRCAVATHLGGCWKNVWSKPCWPVFRYLTKTNQVAEALNLLRDLPEDNPVEISNAIECLSQMSLKPAGINSTLIPYLRHPQAMVREAALHSIDDCFKNKELMSAVRECTQDSNEVIAELALDVLEELVEGDWVKQ